MGCRNRELSGGENPASASLGEALLFTTMCIIGLPVDVHVRDGSIYSGTFHTACVENDYGIVLKKARMTKKGNCDANVASEDVIETLVVLSEDLVQVVAKGVLLPVNGIVRDVTGDIVGDIAGDIARTVPSSECANREEKIKESKMTNTDTSQTSKTRQVEDGKSEGKQFNHELKGNIQFKETTNEVQSSSSSFDACVTQSKAVEEDIAYKPMPRPSNHPAPSVVKLNNQFQDGHSLEDSACLNAISSGVSTSGTSFVNGTTESHVSSSPTLTEMAPPKSSKESKLNPGAKLFCPSSVKHRSVTPPAMPTVANVAYIPDNFPGVSIASAQPEVEISPFVPRSSLPTKISPYGNLMAGNGMNDSQYSQSITGHMGSRTQPVRYAGQHHHSVQAGPAYMHSNSQNVMVGRLGQLVYMHPVSHDVNQGAAAFSQVSTRPLLTPHQGHLPKHQGNTAAHALQLCMTPPFIAGGQQQQFAVQSHIPVPQPTFPVLRPISVPGSNGIFGTKFP